MSKKILAALCLAFPAASAIGCASGSLQQKVDDLTRDQEELQRKNAELEAELMTYKARCESLEQSRRAPPPRPMPPPEKAAASDFPSDLKGKVDIRRRGSDTVIDIPSDVFFASGSATLGKESERTMQQIADYIRRSHPNGALRVEGHSDSDPIRRAKGKFHCNWDLSFQRAHAVMHWLVEKGGLDPRRVVCEAYGEYRPLDPSNKSKNRRVEIVVSP